MQNLSNMTRTVFVKVIVYLLVFQIPDLISIHEPFVYVFWALECYDIILHVGIIVFVNNYSINSFIYWISLLGKKFKSIENLKPTSLSIISWSIARLIHWLETYILSYVDIKLDKQQGFTYQVLQIHVHLAGCKSFVSLAVLTKICFKKLNWHIFNYFHAPVFIWICRLFIVTAKGSCN